ncbi:hypothetical protein MMC08_006026 [Hypocenomyce scalaris]|nr:hypothetical protein [Hypocenomyce scalaris]
MPTNALDNLDKPFPFLNLHIELRTASTNSSSSSDHPIKVAKHSHQPSHKAPPEAERAYEGRRTLRSGNACPEPVHHLSRSPFARSTSSLPRYITPRTSSASWELGFFHIFLAAIGPTNMNLITTIYLLQRRASIGNLAGMEGLNDIARWPVHKHDISYIIPAVSL